MAKLKKVRIAREPVEMDDGQSFDVRAISTNDLMCLVQDYGGTLAMIFAELQTKRQEGTGTVTTADVKTTLLQLAKDFPDAAAAIIALAGDSYDPEGMEVARELPFPDQVQALETIFRLTFRSEGAVKKLIETATTAMTALAGSMMNELGLRIGTGDSDASAIT